MCQSSPPGSTFIRRLALTASLILASAAQAQEGDSDGARRRFSAYPSRRVDAQAHYLSSFDRSGGNDDGFNGTYSALYVDERNEHVIFDVKGPGTLFTLWFTSRENGWAPLGWGRIKFYFDDEAAPRIDMDVDELFSGKRPPFQPPFVYNRFTSSGGNVSYLPIPFSQRLRITTERRVGFYNAYYHTYSPERRIESWTGKEPLAELSELWKQAGHNPHRPEADLSFTGMLELPAPLLPDGDMEPTRSELLRWEGQGAITSIELNPLLPLTPFQLNHIILRAYWDGESEPAIDAPLGSFFGSGLGEASVRAVPIGMSPSGRYYCFFPMPFWQSSRLELMNENPDPTPKIWWRIGLTSSEQRSYREQESGHFHARYRREWPTTHGKDYRIAAVEGSGLYLGQVMTVEPLRSEVKRWWEGDLRVYIDGRRQAAFHGTGHEDEYLGGWSNEWLMNPYSLPWHGEPMTRQLRPVDFQWSAATTVYRFFPEGIPFQNGIELTTEHGTGNSVDAMYSSVAYYYQHDGRMELVDAFDVASDTAGEHRYEVEPAADRVKLTSRFEGSKDELELTASGFTITNASRFRLTNPRPESTLRLRRLFDQSTRQEAEVFIGGERAGTWYTSRVNEHHRWAEADFLLPGTLTRGRRELDIEIKVVEGHWSEFRYELWALP